MFCLSYPKRMTMADVNAVENRFVVTTGEMNGRFISLGIERRGGRVKVISSVVPKKCNRRYQTHCTAHTVLENRSDSLSMNS